MTSKTVTSAALLLIAVFAASTAIAAPISAPTIRGDVHAALVRPLEGIGAVLYSQSNDLPPAPTASGFGGVNNSLGQADPDSYGGGGFGSQTYGGSVSWADGSASSYIGSPFSFPAWDGSTATVHGGGTADASLNLDLSGAPHGSSAEGLTSGGFGGYTYDGSDTAGENGLITFEVEFTINALAAGSDVEGAFGIQVDAFSWALGDLALTDSVVPYVTGSSIVGSVDMTEEDRIDSLGDAWTFSLTAAEIVALDGSVDGTYTAHFDFLEPIHSPSANAAFLTINAFAMGAASAVPEPSTLALAVLGFAALLGIRFRRRR